MLKVADKIKHFTWHFKHFINVVKCPRFSGMLSPYSTLPPPFPKQPFPLFKPTPALLPPTPSPLLNHRTIQTAKTHLPQPSYALLPPPLFWPTPVPPTSCCVSLFCLLSPTSCTLPPFHLCLSPYQMVPSSPPNLAVTSIFHAYPSPSRFGPPLTRFCPTLS